MMRECLQAAKMKTLVEILDEYDEEADGTIAHQPLTSQLKVTLAQALGFKTLAMMQRSRENFWKRRN